MFDTIYPASVRPEFAPRGIWVPCSPGSHYRFSAEGHQLSRVVGDVGPEQIAALTFGEAEFALVLEEPLIVVCSRFGSALPWSSGTFHWHRVPRSDRQWPAASSTLDDGIDLEISLVDASDGRLRATRTVRLPASFARVLHEALLEQARFSYDPTVERRALDGLLRRCPSTGALVANATVRVLVPAAPTCP